MDSLWIHEELFVLKNTSQTNVLRLRQYNREVQI